MRSGRGWSGGGAEGCGRGRGNQERSGRSEEGGRGRQYLWLGAATGGVGGGSDGGRAVLKPFRSRGVAPPPDGPPSGAGVGGHPDGDRGAAAALTAAYKGANRTVGRRRAGATRHVRSGDPGREWRAPSRRARGNTSAGGGRRRSPWRRPPLASPRRAEGGKKRSGLGWEWGREAGVGHSRRSGWDKTHGERGGEGGRASARRGSSGHGADDMGAAGSRSDGGGRAAIAWVDDPQRAAARPPSRLPLRAVPYNGRSRARPPLGRYTVRPHRFARKKNQPVQLHVFFVLNISSSISVVSLHQRPLGSYPPANEAASGALVGGRQP